MKKKDKATPAHEPLKMPAPELLDVASINFAPYNPRVMPPEKMRALKASLVKHGLVLNLVVQKQGLVLIGGHQRVTAMREVCAERGVEMPAQAWATVLDVDDATAKQLNVGLNNIEGEFDHYKLGLMFAEMLPSMTTDDVLATGFEQENIEQMIALTSDTDAAAARLEAEAEGLGGFARSVTLTVDFETVEQRDRAKEVLREAAERTGKKAGAVLLDALKRHGPPPKAKGNGKHARA